MLGPRGGISTQLCLSGPQVSQMSEMISLKMGVKFAISHNMGQKIRQGSCVIMCKNSIAGHVPCEID